MLFGCKGGGSILFVDVHIVVIGAVFKLKSSQTLNNEVFVDERSFRLICSHFGRF